MMVWVTKQCLFTQRHVSCHQHVAIVIIVTFTLMAGAGCSLWMFGSCHLSGLPLDLTTSFGKCGVHRCMKWGDKCQVLMKTSTKNDAICHALLGLYSFHAFFHMLWVRPDLAWLLAITLDTARIKREHMLLPVWARNISELNETFLTKQC